jgi:BirA family biotin operon repressor/biotin-[acetyl-CoA-carboxylase] ligase
MGNLFGSIFFPLKNNYPSFSEFSMINPVIISEVIKKFCKKKKISFKWPNDVFVDGRKICGILQELITSNDKKFLIIGIGINIVSNPNINTNYEATNIFLETKKKPTTEEIINQLIASYENFFRELDTYNFINFKTKAESMSVNNQ